MTQKIVSIGGVQSELELAREGSAVRAGEQSLEIIAVRDDELEIRIDGVARVVPFAVNGSTISFAYEGEIYIADVSDKSGRGKARHRDHSTEAPMPGVVLKILVAAGDVVSKGAPLLILEAMKMEHSIVAPRDGTVGSVNCREGELVQPGLELVTMKE